jgi:hypothetical protein
VSFRDAGGFLCDTRRIGPDLRRAHHFGPGDRNRASQRSGLTLPPEQPRDHNHDYNENHRHCGGDPFDYVSGHGIEHQE